MEIKIEKREELENLLRDIKSSGYRISTELYEKAGDALELLETKSSKAFSALYELLAILSDIDAIYIEEELDSLEKNEMEKEWKALGEMLSQILNDF